MSEDDFWAQIDDLALKSVVALEPELRIWERARQDIDVKGGAASFQLLGFDILILCYVMLSCVVVLCYDVMLYDLI